MVEWTKWMSYKPTNPHHWMAIETFQLHRKGHVCFWKALAEGFSKPYDTPPFFGNKKKFSYHQIMGVCRMAIKKTSIVI
jgi:hypothetical protein